MWFDSHCHLHICEEEGRAAEGLIEGAAAGGVTRMLTIGIDEASSERAVELATGGVYASVGLHPNSADRWTDALERRIREWLAHDRVVAVGETGLDFYWDAVEPRTQHEVFAAHIALAKESDKALVIHTRESVEAALEQLEEQGAPARTIFHCWSGDLAALERALALGCFVSFAGNVSFKSAQILRDAAARVPDERLLVETDSPYLAPVPHRGERNEPAFVADVGAAVAAARDMPVEEVARITTANALRAFALD